MIEKKAVESPQSDAPATDDKKPVSAQREWVAAIIAKGKEASPTVPVTIDDIEYFIVRNSFGYTLAIHSTAMSKAGLSELNITNPLAWQSLVAATLYIDVATSADGKTKLFANYEKAFDLACSPEAGELARQLFEACTTVNKDILK
jgi:hypothetical protein